ncbi:MAG: EAL domain-containing protein [Alphaproteobacteria bacterium]|uniref:EAL domain-containing protein n=1 Tax=Candidatus Nitrobium versatile TaxID=2884831 RepID=A0A953M0X5_9BACT|nr:EAL domain-containing protein [Candidatus Nitrobium versatile]
MKKLQIAGFLLGILFFLLITVFSYLGAKSLLEVPEKRIRIATRIGILERIRDQVNAAVLSQRGYTITGDAGYLSSYYKAISAEREEFKKIGQAGFETRSQEEKLNRLEGLVSKRIDFIDVLIDFQRAGVSDTQQEGIAIGQGEALSDEIKKGIDELVREDNTLFRQLEGEASSALVKLIATLLLGAFLSTSSLALAFYFYRSRSIKEAESGKLLQAIIDNSPAAIYLKDKDLRLILANKKCELLFGLPKEQLLGKTAHDLLSKELADAAAESDLRVLRQGISLISEERILSGGEMHTYLSNKFPLRDPLSGSPYRVACILTDITEREQMEQALRESEERFRLIADTMPNLAWTARPDGEVDYWNRYGLEYTGLPEMGGGKEWSFAVIHSEDRQAAKDAWEKAVQTGTPYEKEHRLRRFDGAYRWHFSRGVPVRNGGGRIIKWYGTTTDIHELREETQQRLRESEERFRMVAEASRTMVYAIEVESGTMSVTRGLDELLGYRQEEIPLSRTWWLSRIHPDDVLLCKEQFKDSEAKGLDFSLEYRVRHKGEHYITVQDTGRVVRNNTGQVVRIVGGVIDITERKQMEATIRHQAHYDLLTGLPNRTLFLGHLTFALSQAHRSQKQLAVMFLDLDRFKTINDTLGHATGDKLLQEVAGRVRLSIRKTDTAARIGGDEFLILLSQVSHPEDVSRIAEKITATFEKPFSVNGYTFYTTASIGISIFPEDGEEAEILIKNADIAMYHAKEEGRNNYQFYSPEMNIRTLERMILENDLRRTLRQGELELFYQPQYNIATGKIVCTEALIRWRHPRLGLLRPAQFLPLAEEMGFILSIDEWVLRTACAQNKALQDAGCPPTCVAVNLSARQFKQAHLEETVSRALQETGLDPKWLAIEVTETIAMGDIEQTISNLKKLSALGIHFSIDDFGTGYSSLSYLKRLPIRKLKIDKSFIRDMTLDTDDQAIVNAIISMAHSMDLKVVAEGVETGEQLSLLRSMGCDEVQGYVGSHPVPAEEYEHLLKTN